MASTLSALLSLGLCLGLGMGDEDAFSSPSLWADPGSLVPVGANVTLWCRGPDRAKQFCVPRLRTTKCRTPSWTRKEAKFHISSVMWEDAGSYCCFYQSESHESPCGHPLDLVVTGIYKKPTILALPGHLVGTGEDVTLQCQAESRFDRFALYKDEQANTSMSYEWRSQANFPIPAVTTAHGGTYRCYSFSSVSPYHWSAPSDPLKLIVMETSPKPGTPDGLSGLPWFWEGILTSISLLLIFLFLVLCHHQQLARFKTKGKEAEGKETLKSWSSTGAMQEQTLYTVVKNSRQNRLEDPAGSDLQEVTYDPLEPKLGPCLVSPSPILYAPLAIQRMGRLPEEGQGRREEL